MSICVGIFSKVKKIPLNYIQPENGEMHQSLERKEKIGREEL